MKNKKIRVGIDEFRFIAAFLVILAHVGPLANINSTANYILTDIISRIAVPFFFMVTGYFVLSKGLENKELFNQYIKKIVKLYILVILIFLPFNIYKGDFNNLNIIEGIKAIFLDGTFYHLWYFPSLILGLYITRFILQKIPKNFQAIMVIFLYIIGLLGDSYYGLTLQNTFLLNIYNVIFSVFSYTRNGLFLTPIFLYMGYKLSSNQKPITLSKNTVFFILSFSLMIFEGLILKNFNYSRHTSMYIMLIPTMYFLLTLLCRSGQARKSLRDITLYMYIFHPLVIILIRVLSKPIHMKEVIVDNPLVLFLVTLIATIVLAVLLEKIKIKIKKKVNHEIESMD